jgi:hypothetical protein
VWQVGIAGAIDISCTSRRDEKACYLTRGDDRCLCKVESMCSLENAQVSLTRTEGVYWKLEEQGSTSSWKN